MSTTRDAIYRSGLTPVWGLDSSTSSKSEAVGLLINSANVTNNIKSYVQTDSNGRDAGVLTYDHSIEMSVSGNVIYDPAGTGGIPYMTSKFTVGKAVTDCHARCLLEAVRINDLNCTAASGDDGTYFVNALNFSQSNDAAVQFDMTVTYYGFDPE